MGGKSVGGAGPMLEYGQKALDLQKEIYDQTRQDVQPWYQTGTQAVGRLGSLMGLAQANNPLARQQLIDQYKGQFTTGGGAVGASTPIIDVSKINFTGSETRGLKNLAEGLASQINAGFKPQATTDQAALNAFIDAKLAEQAAAERSDPLFGSLAKSFGMEDYEADPGYQFRLSEGNKALERAMNARGKTFSPEAMKALQDFGQQSASQEYGNAFNRYNINQDNLFNRLAALSGMGQTSSGQLAGAGQNYAAAGSDLYTGMGNAITAANQAKASGRQSMFNTLLGAGVSIGTADAGSPFAKWFGG